MLLLGLLLMAMVASAGIGAQPVERPMALEVAQAMDACLRPGPADPFMPREYWGDVRRAVVAERDVALFALARFEPNMAHSESGADYWLADDPISPPMVLSTRVKADDDGRPLPDGAVACFEQEYRRLLAELGPRGMPVERPDVGDAGAVVRV